MTSAVFFLRMELRDDKTDGRTQLLPPASSYWLVVFGIIQSGNLWNAIPPQERQTHEVYTKLMHCLMN